MLPFPKGKGNVTVKQGGMKKFFNATPRMRIVDFEISVPNEKSHGTVTVKENQQSQFQSA